MTNEIRTHRFIVTVPDLTGEESDEVVAMTEEYLRDDRAVNATVTHALGETLPEHLRIGYGIHRDIFEVVDRDHDVAIALNASEARQLAGVLLRLADEVESP